MAGPRFYLDLGADNQLRISLAMGESQSGVGYITGPRRRFFESSPETVWAYSDRYYFLKEEEVEDVLEVIRQYLINKAKEEGKL